MTKLNTADLESTRREAEDFFRRAMEVSDLFLHRLLLRMSEEFALEAARLEAEALQAPP